MPRNYPHSVKKTLISYYHTATILYYKCYILIIFLTFLHQSPVSTNKISPLIIYYNYKNLQAKY